MSDHRDDQHQRDGDAGEATPIEARAQYHALVGEIIVSVNDIETTLWLTISTYLHIDTHRWSVFLRVIAPSLALDAKRQIVHAIAKERTPEAPPLFSDGGPVARAIAARNKYAHSALTNLVNPGGEQVGPFGLAVTDHRRGRGGAYEILEELADIERVRDDVLDALRQARNWANTHRTEIKGVPVWRPSD